MAGDWIKMRGALLDHPKVVRIARELQKNTAFREWLTPGGSGEMNGQLCSVPALRCVTTALLMRVWSAAREHGRFVGDDLVLEHSEIPDLDQMAGAPGVGEAMQVVRWALAENGVTLPNFKEFNVPMTPAEKQREYRKRHSVGNGEVTEALPKRGNGKRKNVTTREEKRREEKPPIDLPPLPHGVTDELWRAFRDSRGKLRKPLHAEAELRARRTLAKLVAEGYDPAKLIDKAIEMGWQSFFPRDDCRKEVATGGALALAKSGTCECGEVANVRVGAKWRCAKHVRGFDKAAA